MKVIYKFKYKDLDSDDEVINMYLPLDTDKIKTKIDAFQEFRSHMREWGVNGLPISATATQSGFPDYCFDISTLHGNKKETQGEELKGRLVWCKVENPIQKESEDWIPAILYEDGTVKSILGELKKKDKEDFDDLREFDDCPFPGYEITKTDGYGDTLTPEIVGIVFRFEE